MCCVLCVVCRMNLQFMSGLNFWKDIGRSGKNGQVFFYHANNTVAAKESILEGLKPFTGQANETMNKEILSLCKEFPLCLYLYPKAYMVQGGAGDLFHLKVKVIRNLAEVIVR